MLPGRYDRSVDPHLQRCLLLAQALGPRQDYPRPPDLPLRGSRASDDTLQLCLLLNRNEKGTDWAGHAIV